MCQDLQDEVFQCYQKNPSEPLNCSKQVKAFTSAVEKARLVGIIYKLTSANMYFKMG